MSCQPYSTPPRGKMVDTEWPASSGECYGWLVVFKQVGGLEAVDGNPVFRVANL